MLGAIIGDIVGSRFEWHNIKSKEFELFTNRCYPTDDSIMSLAVAKSLVECNDDYDKLHDIVIKNMVEIGRQHIDCGFGGHFIQWIIGDKHEPYNSYGNGSAMRGSPCGFAGKTLDEVKRLSRIVSEVSHNHPEGLKGAEAVAVSIFLARNGKKIEEIKQYVLDNYYDIDFTIDEIRESYKFDVSCQGSVPQALEAFFESTSFEDAIRNAISIGGDSDTIACITGGIAAAYYGIPDDIRKEAICYLDKIQSNLLYNFENKYENGKNNIDNYKRKNESMKENELKRIEDKLWDTAEKLRGAVSVADYKFIALGLIFLKYISDSFEDKYNELVKEGKGFEEERDAYTAENIFYVPKQARWEYLVQHSKEPNIGEIIDDALTMIEKENQSLKNVLPKNYNSPTMRNVNLGELLDLFTNIKIGSKEAKEKDILGRIYEYFLGQFAKSELQKGGEFYTPACLVRTMVECIEPFKGNVYDPACGSGGMFVQSMKFVEEHQGNMYDVGIFGQEKNPTTWRLAKMNLAIRSMYGDLGKYAADTFTEDLHKDLKADYILANPPFNLEWDRDKVENDYRWKYGLAPKNNANYAWLQHMISKLSQNGKMACILANGSLAAGGQEGEIRKKLIENDLVDCILLMPYNLFYTVTVSCSIWIINRNKKQRGKTLFINASNLGTMVTRRLRELSESDISKIASTYHNYQNNNNYQDVKGFCHVATLDEIKEKEYTLAPNRYVGFNGGGGSTVSFEEKMREITTELSKQFQESHKLEEQIKENLKAIGYEI